MNTIIIDKTPHVCVMCWGKVVPKEGTFWSGKKYFLEKLKLVENELIKTKQTQLNMENNNCKLCSLKNISHFRCIHKNIVWEEGLYHYVEQHNIKPPSKFIRFILDNDPTIVEKCKTIPCIPKKIKINGIISDNCDKENKNLPNNFTYVKIRANQLMILDALMEHGGVTQKYKEKHDMGYKYSEHAGMLEFKNRELTRVIITGETPRSTDDDPEIYLPLPGNASYKYEYVFHTHPPTPTPGSRTREGVLYEFPSKNDVENFIEHFNDGKVQGSLVITPEGLYNIRKYTFDKIKIAYSKALGKAFRKISDEVQANAIQKFKNQFSYGNQNLDYFYSVIAQDTTYIDAINNVLKKYEIYIDYFPRQKTKNNHWIIGTIYLPICLPK